MKPHPHNDATDAWESAKQSIASTITEQRTDLAHLLFILIEEHTANGGKFASMESDILFRRFFWGESDTSHTDVLQRLFNNYRK